MPFLARFMNILSVFRPERTRLFHLIATAALSPIGAAAGPLMIGAIVLLDAAPAMGQCAQTGTTENCSGNLPAAIDFNTNLGIDTLNVGNANNGTSFVRLQGSGTMPTNGANAVFSCSVANECTITTNTDGSQSCSPKTDIHGNPLGACIAGTTTGGPSGHAGPNVTVKVATPTSGPITVGASRPNIAVIGLSRGSNGGGGGDSFVAGSAGDGGTGADGGTASVDFSGVVPNGNFGGILAESQAGNGGNGGSFFGIGGSAGNGGLGGFGGASAAGFDAGSITTSGKGNVGVTAISQGGNGGSAGNGGGLVFVGGSGSGAGQAGKAEVDTVAGTSIVTFGDFANGIAAYSFGGGGGSGSGGFGLFFSGGGNGSTGGAGGQVIVNANGAITTEGQFAEGILAQSIGGGGGSAGTVIGAVALGGSGAGGGAGGNVQVSNTGTIATLGFGSNAIEGQSIGGGGGNGANSGGSLCAGRQRLGHDDGRRRQRGEPGASRNQLFELGGHSRAIDRRRRRQWRHLGRPFRLWRHGRLGRQRRHCRGHQWRQHLHRSGRLRRFGLARHSRAIDRRRRRQWRRRAGRAGNAGRRRRHGRQRRHRLPDQ